MPAVPKPVKSTPETRRAERQKRDQHPFKVYTKKKAPKPLRRSKIGVRKPFKPWRVKSWVIRSLNQRTGIKAGGKLKVVGKRGKRLAPEDRRQSRAVQDLPCVCGCNLPVQHAHLKRRNVLSTRHDPTYSIPACDFLHDWLDQGMGTAVRPQLFDMAAELQRRLTHEDIFQALKDAGYYTWLVDKRRII